MRRRADAVQTSVTSGEAPSRFPTAGTSGLNAEQLARHLELGALEILSQEGKVTATGEFRWRRYRLSDAIGHDDGVGR